MTSRSSLRARVGGLALALAGCEGAAPGDIAPAPEAEPEPQLARG